MNISHKRLSLITATLCAVVLLIATAACGKHKPELSRPVLTVSIEPLRYVVENICGNLYEVRTIMPQGASPETYEPTPRQMMELSDSRLVFRAGSLGFEQTSLPKMLNAAHDAHLVSLEEGITPIADADAHHGSESGYDPHTWMSTENLRIYARNACEALSRLDSAHADTFRVNLARFEERLNSLDNELAAELKPLVCRSFLIYHPALGYFARQYGLRQMAVEADGKEPSVSRMQTLVSDCKDAGAKVCFISAEHAGEGARRIAETAGLRVVEINPLAYDVCAQFRNIAKALKDE